MRAIFCGNFEFDARESDLQRLFRKYGKVDRVDLKSGFAFIYMEDERDAEDAIRGLDRFEFGRSGRRLRVEWTKRERGSGRHASSRKPPANSRPSKTLFVINFDPNHTRTMDLERHFDLYGKILNVRIRRNFAFIQFESQEDATKALDATNMSKLMDRVITVEYAVNDNDDRRNGSSPNRARDRSPQRGYGRGRSPSPYRRERGSPDYGREVRASPDYGHKPRGRSPSPVSRKRKSEHGHSPSPRKERGSLYSRERSASPRRDRASLENGKGLSAPDYGRLASPEEGERISPVEYRVSRSSSPRNGHMERADMEESPAPEQYRSRSPVARQRSRS